MTLFANMLKENDHEARELVHLLLLKQVFRVVDRQQIKEIALKDPDD